MWLLGLSISIRQRYSGAGAAVKTRPFPPAQSGIDLAGIDLLAGPDGYVVLEVNGAVDFTPEYGLSGSDPFLVAVDAIADAFAEPKLMVAT